MTYEELKTVFIDDLEIYISYHPNQNSFNNNYFLNQDNITKLAEILDNYVFNMNISDYFHATMSNAICQISELNDKCSGELIDEYRKSLIQEFLLIVAKSVDFKYSLTVLQSNTRWL